MLLVPANPAPAAAEVTRTLSAGILAALERGDRAVREYQALLECGTAEDIWIDDMRRAAAVRWDILRHRALCSFNFPESSGNAPVWGNGTRN